ncbi:MAG: DUF2207 domain-containing protein, partial [Bacteroidales bacterium]|nr:DUF2207 domain-containing protein [Bacteroidales bacterium]
LAAAAALLLSVAAFGRAGSIRDVDISVWLEQNGTARITEVWKVNVTDGTEWYLVRKDLGDIRISGLSVVDETGRKYIVEDEWDSDRPRSEKACRCGLLHKRNGVEICWGIGDYGERTWKVNYTMSNAVKSLTDADMLHLQLLSPGLSSTPQHVKARISADGLTQDKVRFWGFGLEGESRFDPSTSSGTGSVVFESSGRIKSLIVLLRFEKGLFHSPSEQNRGFEQVLAEALKGARFEDEGDSSSDGAFWKLLEILFYVASFLLGSGLLAELANSPKKVLGCRKKDVQWNRDLPYGGDLLKSNYTLGRLEEIKKGNCFASALILRMVYKGALVVNRSSGDKVDIAFNDSVAAGLDADSRGLYDMLKSASGSDEILQDNEFSRWSKRNYKTVNKWITDASKHGQDAMKAAGQLDQKSIMGTPKYTPAGQEEARKLLGFKKFLSDFTLISERGSQEVTLWQDYLVFGAMFGIADKVAKELHDINPKLFEDVVMLDYDTTRWLLWRNNQMAGAITNAQIRASEAMGRSSGSFGGFGGGTSFGGGGGFSGGGFGGGAR